MEPYCYRPIPTTNRSIRLLRLLPAEDENADIQCDLFDYTLQNARDTHLYEALSYVWGDPNDTLPISVSGCRMDITVNLHAGLLRLRNHSLDRILWVDAICINQEDEQEKASQIQFMVVIYDQATRVVAWLGEAAHDSSLAFEAIHAAGRKNSTAVTYNDEIHAAGMALLHRPWFRRIWILQEVAAARSVLLVCGPDKLDGYAFALGLESWEPFSTLEQHLRNLILSVTYLIKEAIFRPYNSLSSEENTSLNVCPLGTLLDMYHAHEATKRHDKIFALLGMSSDVPTRAGLLLDYTLTWEELMKRLLKHVISKSVTISVVTSKQVAVIKGRGYVYGTVHKVAKDPVRGDQRCLQILEVDRTYDTRPVWKVPVTANEIQQGDIVCSLAVAAHNTIIRAHDDYFTIVCIAVEVLKLDAKEEHDYPKQRGPFPGMSGHRYRDFVLIWNWENSTDNAQDVGSLEAWMRKFDTNHDKQQVEQDSTIFRARMRWNVESIVDDVPKISMRLNFQSHPRGREAVHACEMIIRRTTQYTTGMRFDSASGTESQDGSAVLDLLRTMAASVEFDPIFLAELPAPLSWAAEGGHEGVIQLLLDSVFVPVDVFFSLAARRGYEALCRALLAIRPAGVNAKVDDRTPLFEAATHGNEAIVRILLAACQVDLDAKCLFPGKNPEDFWSYPMLDLGHWTRTPLSQAAFSGKESIVRLLLDTGKVDVNIQDEKGDTPLLYAIAEGHEDTVKLLLKQDMIGVNIGNKEGETPLTSAVAYGRTEIVELLLGTGKIDFSLADLHDDGRLSRELKSLKKFTAQRKERLTDQEWSKERNTRQKRYDAINSLLHEACWDGYQRDGISCSCYEQGNVERG